ncbi:MAG: tRNA (N6-isopentenyl adenosine(37)-C2)-methylthiotransferase MiaB [Candidatus Eremiobacteraeota bacterium]|nr:tRNA (N6-isopentenyl adenosine(37)-C2)-methylthiotransferase MiaB [Candidatus Eremiobacteraeota bacterium]
MASIYIETFGCAMNEADSQYIADRAASAGYSVATKAEGANVVVLNTCTVRDSAERRAYGRMGHYKLLKAGDPDIKLVVTGCLAEQDRDSMQRKMPHIDGVFGTSELVALGDTITAWRSEFDDTEYTEDRALVETIGGSADCVAGAFSHLRGYVTVQRGCSYYCTFCIVPHVRGRFDHRPVGEILTEVAARIAEGAREITLVGQTVNAYKDASSGQDFGDLLRAVAQLDGLERLTFITPHPKDFSEKIIADMAAVPQLNPRMHLPVQSASDGVLRRMNRKYTLQTYNEKVALIRRYLPDWSITTDIIVGFPGESERDLQMTLDYCKQMQYAQAFMFIYSPRRGTPASKWEQVPALEASERLRRLAVVQNEACRNYHDRKIGTTVRTLITGPSRKDARKLATKSGDNVTVVAPMPQDYDEALYAAEPWLDIRIQSAHVWGCTGTIVRRAARVADAGNQVNVPVLDLVSHAALSAS